MIRPFALVVLIAALTAPGASSQQPTNTTPAQPPAGGILGRPSPPQPTQKQAVEYFVGTWQFKWTGRESPLTAGPRAGVAVFEQLGDTPFLTMRVEGKIDGGGAFKEAGTLGWHAGQKVMAMQETLSTGVQILSVGDWTSPIAIRFESAPATVGKQTVRLKRTYNILSATSFSVNEELSLDGGPFTRLGSGVFSKSR